MFFQGVYFVILKTYKLSCLVLYVKIGLSLQQCELLIDKNIQLIQLNVLLLFNGQMQNFNFWTVCKTQLEYSG